MISLWHLAAASFLATAAMLTIGCAGRGAPTARATPVITLGSNGVLVPGEAGRRGFYVSVSPVDREGEFPGDVQEILVLSLDEEVIARETVETSYGVYRVDLVDLTGDGVRELVCIFGQGRGTSVRSEELIVKEIRGGKLVDLLRTPRSEYFWAEGRWWYDLEYGDLNRDGTTDLRMTLGHTPLDDRLRPHAESIPEAKTRDYCWDKNQKKMVLLKASGYWPADEAKGK